MPVNFFVIFPKCHDNLRENFRRIFIAIYVLLRNISRDILREWCECVHGNPCPLLPPIFHQNQSVLSFLNLSGHANFRQISGKIALIWMEMNGLGSVYVETWLCGKCNSNCAVVTVGGPIFWVRVHLKAKGQETTFHAMKLALQCTIYT